MSFPELIFLESLIESLQGKAEIRQLAKVGSDAESFPIYSLAFGAKNPEAPTLAIVGGVHGQEKIGSQVVLSFLETLTELLEWDETTHHLLEHTRLVFLPIVNPVGMSLLRRGNGNRVDLMRNAPGESSGTFLVGGQRISPYLPWYRGKKGAPMETEAQALCDFIKREVFPARVSIALDVHSGFGTVDRLWFPYSKAAVPFASLAEANALKNLFDTTFPNHVYHMEPNSHGYLIAGDLWDHLYDAHQAEHQGRKQFLPLTLEMGSWLWLKKNPVQLFSALGLFHPMHLHRHKRILRRHLTLLEFLHKAVRSPQKWAFLPKDERVAHHKSALELWYEE